MLNYVLEHARNEGDVVKLLLQTGLVMKRNILLEQR